MSFANSFPLPQSFHFTQERSIPCTLSVHRRSPPCIHSFDLGKERREIKKNTGGDTTARFPDEKSFRPPPRAMSVLRLKKMNSLQAKLILTLLLEVAIQRCMLYHSSHIRLPSNEEYYESVMMIKTKFGRRIYLNFRIEALARAGIP
jgi:hypothetical protein